MNLIGLLEEPTSGKILFDGVEITSRRDRLDFYRNRVGFVFQNFALLDNKTVKENLTLVKRRHRQEGVTMEDALKKVGLIDKLNNKIYTLSGGEQQRVALARLYFKQCSLILADEPTGSLDKENATEVLKILRQLNSQKRTVILVTHDSEIKRQCDRIIELR